MLLAYQSFFVRQQAETVANSEFKSALKAGRVIEVTLTDAAVTGKLSSDAREQRSRPGEMAELQSSGKSPQAFATVRVDDPTLIQETGEGASGSVAPSLWRSSSAARLGTRRQRRCSRCLTTDAGCSSISRT